MIYLYICVVYTIKCISVHIYLLIVTITVSKLHLIYIRILLNCAWEYKLPSKVRIHCGNINLHFLT